MESRKKDAGYRWSRQKGKEESPSQSSAGKEKLYRVVLGTRRMATSERQGGKKKTDLGSRKGQTYPRRSVLRKEKRGNSPSLGREVEDKGRGCQSF